MPAPRTLPWSWYSDPDVLRREQDRIFRQTWQYVGHAGRVEGLGDRFAAWAGDVPVLVVRAEDGIRAFLNVCRHRGSLLAESVGTGRRSSAPTTRGRTPSTARSGLRRARSGRRALTRRGSLSSRCASRDGGRFLFVNPDADAAPLAETLGPMPELVPLDDLVFHARDEYELAANWKIGCENYLECYHCPVAHKGFSAAYDVDPDEYRLESTGKHVLSQFAHTREAGEGQAQFHFVWPNLRINVFAGTPNLSIGPLLPAGPERSTGFLDYFFASDADRDWVEELLAFDRQVGAEDRVLVERVQKGVSSGILDEGRLLDKSEQLVARFQELVGTALS